jgi:hypothetical protein
VHPRPDIKTYIPEEHYDPIEVTKLEVLMIDPLDPQEEIEKYKRKRDAGQSVEERKDAGRKDRMKRLRTFTYN